MKIIVNYISLSSSKRDEDNLSDFDKYESNLIKQDELTCGSYVS